VFHKLSSHTGLLGFHQKKFQYFFNAIQRGKKGYFNENSTIQAMKDIQEFIEDTPHKLGFKVKVY
jgi:hypothetical protein